MVNVVRCFLQASCMLLLFCGSAWASLQTSVSPSTISLQDTTNLSITMSDGDGEPDTTPLEKDFEIISRQQSSSYQYINGSMSSSKTWQFTLQPRRAGRLQIPAITVGKQRTQPVFVQVNSANTAQQGGHTRQLWLELTAEPKDVRVQQQIMVSLKIYQALSLNQAQLSDLQVEHAVVQQLSGDKNYQQSRDGRMWNVTERRYAVFPQQHGVLHIQPVQLDGNVMVSQSGNRFFSSVRPVHVRSNALDIEVQGIVDHWQYQEWLPARALQLHEVWPQQKEFHVGESITRSITIQAAGQLASQLPDIKQEMPQGLKAYPEQPELSDKQNNTDLIGLRQQKIAILPTQPGHYVLPEITIPWWDVNTQQVRIARIAKREFDVLAAVAENTVMPKSTLPAESPLDHEAVAEVVTKVEQANFWKPLALFAMLGWLSTVLWMFWRGRKIVVKRADEAVQSNKKILRQQLVSACKAQDARACEQALRQYAEAQPATRHCHSLTAIAAHVDEPLRGALLSLDAVRYGETSDAEWQAQALLDAFEATEWPQEKHKQDAQQGLPPLYPS